MPGRTVHCNDNVAVPLIKIFKSEIKTLSWYLHRFYHANVTDSLNCYFAATVCLIVLKYIANLLVGSVHSLG